MSQGLNNHTRAGSTVFLVFFTFSNKTASEVVVIQPTGVIAALSFRENPQSEIIQ